VAAVIRRHPDRDFDFFIGIAVGIPLAFGLWAVIAGVLVIAYRLTTGD
jgi:hypothetical protein